MAKSRLSYQKHNLVDIIQSGDDFMSAMESIIASAQREIHIQTYILEPDETGRRIMDALKSASADRGVKIYLMVDAYGSQNLSSQVRQDLKNSGILIKRFGKLYYRGAFHIGRRLHRKVIVADGETAMVGGINISNKYTHQKNSPAWLDFAVMIRGDAARRLLLICRQRWMNIRFKTFPKSLRDDLDKSTTPDKGSSHVRVSQNDFINRKNEIAINYRNYIRKSRESITIVGGYFLPGGRVRRLLKNAVHRGVSIRVIVSEKSDVKLVFFARRYLYSWLLKNNIAIYEYLPSNVHGKVLICDRKHVSVGSYDLNNLSTYSNLELNLEISDENFAGLFTERLNKIMKDHCRIVTPESYRKRMGAFSIFLSWLAYQTVKTLFVLSVLLAKKSE